MGTLRTGRTCQALEHQRPLLRVSGVEAYAVCMPITSSIGRDGRLTELVSLVLACPFHHRLHHRGGIAITGHADRLVDTPTEGPALPGTSFGERTDWWCYNPYEPQPPTTTN